VTSPPRTVRLVDVPVELYLRAQQHTDDVVRELVLMAAHHAAPVRVTALAQRADAHHEGRLVLRHSVAGAVDAAGAAGEKTVDLTYAVDAATADSSEAWSAVLDELAELCRDGTMLAVPASDDVALFSRWFCQEFVAQLRDGAEPTPWPAYAATARLDA
jgi:hypothetical protein